MVPRACDCTQDHNGSKWKGQPAQGLFHTCLSGHCCNCQQASSSWFLTKLGRGPAKISCTCFGTDVAHAQCVHSQALSMFSWALLLLLACVDAQRTTAGALNSCGWFIMSGLLIFASGPAQNFATKLRSYMDSPRPPSMRRRRLALIARGSGEQVEVLLGASLSGDARARSS